MTAQGGNTDSGFYNFFIGRELNPRVWGFDIKHFVELYPGLIGWLLIDLGMVAKQQQVGAARLTIKKSLGPMSCALIIRTNLSE